MRVVPAQKVYPITFIFKLFYLVVAVPSEVLLRLWRWLGRSITLACARQWPRTDATVESSFELDESSKRVRNLLRNLLEDQFHWNSGWFPQPPEMNDIYDDDYGNDKSKPWLSGIHYSYHVGGAMYSGSYLLPPAHKDSRSATKAGRAWVGKRIIVRYNLRTPAHSCFLKVDGAPGMSRIPAGLDTEPHITTLSLKQFSYGLPSPGALSTRFQQSSRARPIRDCVSYLIPIVVPRQTNDSLPPFLFSE